MFTYTHTLYASYIAYINQAIVNIFPTLIFIVFKNDFNLSISQIAFLSSFNFLMQMIVDFLAIKYIEKIGYRKTIVIAHISSTLGFILLGILPFMINPFNALLLVFFINAISGGLIEVLISPIVEALPEKQKTKVMNILHSFYCWGSMFVIIFSTLFFNIYSINNWKYLSFIWAIIPAINTFIFAKVPINTLSTNNDHTSENNIVSIRKLLSVKIVMIFVVLMICAGASEMAMAQWISFFTETALNIDKSFGDIFGASMFAFCMGIMRVIFAIKSDKINIIHSLMIASLFCIIGYIIASLASNAIISIIGCAIVALSVSIMWPSIFSLSAKLYSKGATSMFALLALSGDIGCSIGTFLVGTVSKSKLSIIFSSIIQNNTEIKIGILSVIVFPIIMLITLLMAKKYKSN